MESCDFCERGISNGNSEVDKKATSFSLAKYSNFLYTVLQVVVSLFSIISQF
jgi:hypothetical protein